MTDQSLAADLSPESAAAPRSVTVVVATRDRPQLLLRCVTAIVQQDYPDHVECIVVFDQSTPQQIDVELPANRTIRLMTNERAPGLPGARNTGILAASGEFTGFCDDDDEWLPDKLAEQTAELRRQPQAAVVGSGLILEQEASEIRRPSAVALVTHDDLLRSRVWELHPSTVLARTKAIREQIGLVDEDIPGGYGEDYDWLLRATELWPIPMVEKPLVKIRWHQASFFQRRWQMIIDALTYLLAKHDDIRAQPAGLARITGQIAFAMAASGQRSASRRMAAQALRANWKERRAYVAVLISLRLVPVDLVLKAAHARGRGI